MKATPTWFRLARDGCRWVCFGLAQLMAWGAVAAEASDAFRLPENVVPEIGCWFWSEAEFRPDGFRPFLDLVGRHAGFRLLTTSLRVPRLEVTEPAVREQIGRAATYAAGYGLKLVMDLDVRLARRAFADAHPEECQEMLRWRPVEVGTNREVELRIAAEVPGDHYTFATTPYVPLGSRLVRAYACRVEGGLVDPESVVDVTELCRVTLAATNELRVAITGEARTHGRQVVVGAAFAHFTPDVFAPHLMSFQREVLAGYRDVPLAGACKDEWGFPPCFDGNPAHDDFWFSRFHAVAYARHTGGRDLVRDSLLMGRPERGREREREAAINHYQQLAWQRNAALEDDFYRGVKETFGSAAVVATHPTWWPHPDRREFKKNGLHWWAATRDLAQTDEVTPFAVRTALAKRWGSPVWMNMFYAASVPEYERAIWSHALAGGRINDHPLYPRPDALAIGNMAALLRGDFARAAARLRLLNFIVRAPLDCPVAVVFGHAAAMNWAGPHFDDVGLALTDALGRAGYPADLIPADEIASGALRLDAEGWVRYGAQRYAAVVLYHPEFEPVTLGDWVGRAARGRTRLSRVGEWTRDLEARPVGFAWPPEVGGAGDVGEAAGQVIAHLKNTGVQAVSAASETIGWDQPTAAFPRRGHTRWLDGTQVWLAGADAAGGDPLMVDETVAGRAIEARAVGVLAVRWSASGQVTALAASGLTRFHSGDLDVTCERPLDVALWIDPDGQRRGAIQDDEGALPAALGRWTTHWTRLRSPPPAP